MALYDQEQANLGMRGTLGVKHWFKGACLG